MWRRHEQQKADRSKPRRSNWQSAVAESGVRGTSSRCDEQRIDELVERRRRRDDARLRRVEKSRPDTSVLRHASTENVPSLRISVSVSRGMVHIATRM